MAVIGPMARCLAIVHEGSFIHSLLISSTEQVYDSLFLLSLRRR